MLSVSAKDARIACALIVHAIVPHVVSDLLTAAKTSQASGSGEGLVVEGAAT